MSSGKIDHEKYSVLIEEPEVYIDNESKKRSGHMSHAMAEFAPGKFIDFNSNCSAVRIGGHFPYGWVEYRISEDSGMTYSDTKILQYSLDSFYDGVFTISVEKAVACDDGTIVAFCLRNDGLDPSMTFCEPWKTPTVVTSNDGGVTWSKAMEYSPYPGRTYDAFYHKGVIYAIHFCNEKFLGKTPDHKYRIYISKDSGKTFEERSVVPFDTHDRGYCSMLLDKDEILHVYAYNLNAEEYMDHAISTDFGVTWTVVEPCFVAKGIRNPQTALIDDVYILHGRAGGVEGFVIYSSEDATHWDEGYMLVRNKDALAFYSNNLNLTDEKGNFLLIQYSDLYKNITYETRCAVNVMHTKVRIKKHS